MRIAFILAISLFTANLHAQTGQLMACAITSDGLFFNKHKTLQRGSDAFSSNVIADSIPVGIAQKIIALGAIRYTGDQFEGLDVVEFVFTITPESGDKVKLQGKSSILNEQMINALKQIKPKSRISFEFIQYITRDEPNYKGPLSVLNFIVY